MMRNSKTIALWLASLAASLQSVALGQQKVDENLQVEVVTVVAQSLGADPANLPDYAAELQAARLTADVVALCGPTPKAQFLTPAVANKVIARAVDLLKQKSQSLWERPRYVRDLVIVSAASFEAGRLAGTSKEYRAAVAASAPAASDCKVAGG
ncbi:hypothetical protein [Paraburkholderia aromaticivorans]|uniref:hypothetical protein n=1 Tax=Paraburkholderia aromaticivorans TaxID=2026199 RepID=UPI0038B786CB